MHTILLVSDHLMHGNDNPSRFFKNSLSAPYVI